MFWVLLLSGQATAPAAPTPLPDVITAYATAGATIIAVVGLIATLVLARRDRKQATADREQAATDRADAKKELEDQRAEAKKTLADQAAQSDERLSRELAAAEERFQRERDAEADQRRHERQVAAAAALLERVGAAMVQFDVLWGLNIVPQGPAALANPWATARQLAAREAIRSLREAAYVTARVLDDWEVVARYRMLVQLVLTVADAPRVFEEKHADHLQHEHFRGRVESDLRNYAKVVMITLSRYMDGKPVPKLRADEYPRFSRQAEDKASWGPSDFTSMLEWDSEELIDPGDTRYRPAL
ncbi:hypothetical protein KDL01_10175 [Actinospica durhamensis]|uniref:Uncharacterized protein n=1 Tax=Actinospica durhamensis TaxID=1508375 RepID=A0A941ENC9_9ACTN|nr:hypothetical protein [Actinospica durhamensis]MBR7833632.1 hypothetical protein [Actinospica durhamensis]